MIVVIERYRDGNQWREHYGCDSCGQRVHWTRANLGDQHDCTPTAVQS